MVSKYKTGMSEMGRPPKYETPDALSVACEAYFLSTDKHTITGLTLYLGFCSRSSLDDYSNRSDDFSYIIKRAKMVVENGYEEMFHNGSNAGIFPLKNMGWKDKTEVAQTVQNLTPLTPEELKRDNDLLDSNY